MRRMMPRDRDDTETFKKRPKTV